MTWRRRTGALLVALLGLAIAAPGAAQDDGARRSAIDLTRRAQEAYDAGRFDDAVELLEAAHRVYPEPTILYNLARSREANGDDEGAAEAYRGYLAERGDADNADQARARLAVVERRIQERRALEEAARPPPSDDVPTDAPVDDEGGSSISVVPWILAGLGAATLGVGIGVGALAQARADEATNAVDHRTAYPLAQESQDLALAATVTLVIGGAVLLVGAIWGIIELATQ
ncbi:MAG: tol-pal system YbgF family protein [Sandaracinaceae bacterium]